MEDMMANTIKVKNDENFQECLYGNCDGYEFELVEEGEWTQDYKYQYRTIILKRKVDGTFWRHGEARTGSPFTDWHYEGSRDEEFTLTQVEPVEVTVTEWKAI